MFFFGNHCLINHELRKTTLTKMSYSRQLYLICPETYHLPLDIKWQLLVNILMNFRGNILTINFQCNNVVNSVYKKVQ